MNGSKASSIYYYDDGGKKRIEETVNYAIKRARRSGVRHLVMFTSDGVGPLKAAETLRRRRSPKIIAVTFPAGQVFADENQELFTTQLAEKERRKELESKGISVVQSTMPFQEVIIPGTSDPKLDAIQATLGLISPGMHLCVQAVLMATDAGLVQQGEEVVSMCADTAIVATGALSHWMFHPEQGLEIREIICKPRMRREPLSKESGRDAKG